jgi:hypothetical protein
MNTRFLPLGVALLVLLSQCTKPVARVVAALG